MCTHTARTFNIYILFFFFFVQKNCMPYNYCTPDIYLYLVQLLIYLMHESNLHKDYSARIQCALKLYSA